MRRFRNKKMQVGSMICVFYASSPNDTHLGPWSKNWSNLVKFGDFGVNFQIITIKWSNNLEILNSYEAIAYNVLFSE